MCLESVLESFQVRFENFGDFRIIWGAELYRHVRSLVMDKDLHTVRLVTQDRYLSYLSNATGLRFIQRLDMPRERKLSRITRSSDWHWCQKTGRAYFMTDLSPKWFSLACCLWTWLVEAVVGFWRYWLFRFLALINDLYDWYIA